METKTLIFVIVIIVLIAAIPITAAAVYYTLRVRGSGNIRKVGLEIYADPDGSIIVDSINWGTLDPGAQVQKTLYFKSTGSVPQTMTMTIENWIPESAEQYFTMSWDYDGSALSPGEIREVTLTLQVSSSIVGITSFSFDYVFVAGSQ
jgi:archaellum component FlaG (FlaF/FlaG flagellin family)